MSQIIQNLSEISDQYEALFVDLWGCVHNGVEAYPAANEALIAYRQRGGDRKSTRLNSSHLV